MLVYSYIDFQTTKLYKHPPVKQQKYSANAVPSKLQDCIKIIDSTILNRLSICAMSHLPVTPTTFLAAAAYSIILFNFQNNTIKSLQAKKQ